MTVSAVCLFTRVLTGLAVLVFAFLVRTAMKYEEMIAGTSNYLMSKYSDGWVRLQMNQMSQRGVTDVPEDHNISVTATHAPLSTASGCRPSAKWARYTALAIYRGETGLGQLEAFFRQRQQVLPFDLHRRAHQYRLARNPPLPVLLAAIEQQRLNSAKSLTRGTGTRWLRGSSPPRLRPRPSHCRRPGCRSRSESPSGNGKRSAAQSLPAGDRAGSSSQASSGCRSAATGRRPPK